MAGGTIQADTIENSAGTGAPNFPFGFKGVNARISGYSSPPSFSITLTPIIFSTIDYDSNGGYSTGTGFYTVPVAGKYMISAKIQGTESTLGGEEIFYIYKNGVAVSQFVILPASIGVIFGLLVSDTINCVVGDQLAIQAESTHTFTLATTDSQSFVLNINLVGT